MRTAPALELTVQPGIRCRVMVSVLALAALASGMAWLSGVWPRMPAGLGMVAAATAVLLVCWPVLAEWRRPGLRLRWDGACWHWQSLAEPQAPLYRGRAEVVADLQGWMLLRLRPQAEPGRARGRDAWLPLQAAQAGLAWHALRRALYSPTHVADPLAAMKPATDER